MLENNFYIFLYLFLIIGGLRAILLLYLSKKEYNKIDARFTITDIVAENYYKKMSINQKILILPLVIIFDLVGFIPSLVVLFFLLIVAFFLLGMYSVATID